MASVYTTARGKNKKNKAKDQSKNGAQCRANKFDSDFAKELGVVKEETLGPQLAPKVSGLTSTAYRLRMEREQRLREQALLTCSNPACPSAPRAEAAPASAGSGGPRAEGSSGEEEDSEGEEEAAAAGDDAGATAGGGGGGGGAPAAAPPAAAAAAAPPALQRCACHLAAYCSTACQRAAWEEHKGPCKAKRAELAEIAVAVALARERAEADALAAEAALLLELGAEEAAAAGGGGGGKAKGGSKI